MSDSEKKAEEIFNKIYASAEQSADNLKFEQKRDIALKSSIICVDEILKNIDATIVYHKDSTTLLFNKSFWLEVKTEFNEMATHFYK